MVLVSRESFIIIVFERENNIVIKYNWYELED